MVRNIRNKFGSLEELGLFVQIFALLTILPFLIKLLSIPRLMSVLTPKNLKNFNSVDQVKAKDKIVEFTDWILGLNFLIYKTRCLKRSLVLYHFLRKLGMDVQVCFGVRLPGDRAKTKLDGHAWLIYEGDIFLEKDIEMTKTYKVTYCFPELKEKAA